MNRRGITMVETVLSTIVVSVLLSGALSATVSSRALVSAADQRRQALWLADELLGEIMRKPYTDPQTPAGAAGPDAGESKRADFDDVDDYTNWKETPAADASGTPIAGAERLTRAVTLSTGVKEGYQVGTGIWADYTVVRVEVYRGDALLCSIKGVRTDAGPGVGP